MKKVIVVLLAVLLLLAGCSGSKQQVGICLRDTNDHEGQGLERLLTEAGYGVTVMDAGNDQSKQDRQVAQLLEDKTDILILEPVMTSALDSISQQVQEKEVPVVFVNWEPQLDGVVYVGCDPTLPGVLQAGMVQGLADGGDLNGDGILSYAYITGPEDHVDAKLRSDGCAQALADAGVQAECLAVEYTDWTREKGQQRCAAVLAKYGKDVEVIFCGNEALSLGAIDAIKDGGRTVGENVYLYGIGGENQLLMLIRSGDLTGTVSRDTSAQMDAVLLAVQSLLGGNTPKNMGYIDYITIDKTNVEEYIAD